ncbi:MAG TPA: hypothetical protein VED40_02550 [Azospirillaceae bacterium]|nr:hypothetical protein [Azospirillaceae bacterium]
MLNQINIRSLSDAEIGLISGGIEEIVISAERRVQDGGFDISTRHYNDGSVAVIVAAFADGGGGETALHIAAPEITVASDPYCIELEWEVTASVGRETPIGGVQASGKLSGDPLEWCFD